MKKEDEYLGSEEFNDWFKKNDDIERHRVFAYKDLKDALYLAYKAGLRQQLADTTQDRIDADRWKFIVDNFKPCLRSAAYTNQFVVEIGFESELDGGISRTEAFINAIDAAISKNK